MLLSGEQSDVETDRGFAQMALFFYSVEIKKYTESCRVEVQSPRRGDSLRLESDKVCL